MTIRIGSHVGMRGKEMLVGAVEEALSYNANALMIYTGAPQNTIRKPITELQIPQGLELLEEHDMDASNIIVHAPYIINLANTIKPATYQLAVDFLKNEIERAEAIGAEHIVLHPGAHVGAGSDIGLRSIIKGLNEVIQPNQKIKIALETMAGKGSECGRTFEELATIIAGVTHNDKISICFDTCHVHDAGYDIVNKLDDVLTEFNNIIGLEKIGVLHINDSKNDCGAQKDRHENIGFGKIGFETLCKIVHSERFPNVCRILETPYTQQTTGNKVSPYEVEIAMLRVQKFDANVLKKLK